MNIKDIERQVLGHINSTTKSLREADISRMNGIMAIGDFIESDAPGAEGVMDKLTTYLRLRGQVNVSFNDVYSALNALPDEDLEELYKYAVGAGMPPLNL